MKVGGFMKLISRKRYLDRMIELKDTPDIKIITGIRRSGKSQLMQTYVEYLRNNFDNVIIIFIANMDLAFEKIKKNQALQKYVEEQYQEEKPNMFS